MPFFSSFKSQLFRKLAWLRLILAAFFLLPGLVQADPGFARPLMAASPSVTINAPSQVMIGESFSFSVGFDNTGDQPGYGPFIDVVFPVQGVDGIDGDPLNPPDGISFLSGGTYAGINLTCENLTFDSSGEITHPYHRNTSGDYSTVTGTPGDTFVSCLLPFGSFVPDQPAAGVTFQATLSEEADAGTPLVIRANGGFQFGEDPLDNWCCDEALPFPYPGDSSSWTSAASVTPTILTLNKTYSGPESETATGPNYPRQFTVTVDVAENQVVDNFVLQDILPDNLQFISLDTISGSGSSTITDLNTPSTSTPGGTISRQFDSITGTAGSSDVSMTFSFYIPRDDASTNRVIDTVSGDDVTSLNNAYAYGDWDPIDDRDDPAVVSGGSVGTPPEYTLNDKSIAIQKSVTNLSPPHSPGDILEYTYSIQISDYFAFEDLEITDLISDGQHVLDSSRYVPQVAVNGNNGYSLSSVEMDSSNYDVICDYSGTQGSECTLDDGSPYTGDTTLELRISDELVTQGRADGKLLGGCVPVGGGTADCSVQDDGPTTITVTYQTEILQEFVDDFPSGDPSVDQGDQLNNSVTISGDVLNNSTLNPQGTVEEDGSSAGITIARDELQKSFYAINGSTSISSPVRVRPGDEITFQLIYDLVTSDVEDLYITDFLPLPVLEVDDFNADGTGGDTWSWTSGTDGKCANLPGGEQIASGVPASGIACFGSGDSFYDYSGITPTLTKDVPANSLEFYYGHYDDNRDQSTRVEILFTITVNNEPYADGLFFTNQAQVHEGSTNAGNQFTDTIVDFILEEPYLVLDKGAVVSDNPNAVFDPVSTGPVTFNAPGTSGLRWSGTISSSGLETDPISSAVSDVDAGDLVSFALVIENQGSSPNGAFDIQVRDVLPTGFSIPSGGSGLNLSVYRGDGAAVSYQSLGTPGDDSELFDEGLELVDPGSVGACQEYDAADGQNIIIITYDLQVDDDIAPGSEMINLGEVFNYANTEGGPDFTGDDADLEASTTTTTALPEINKTFQTTNQAFTADRDVAIGEIVTYQTVLTVPEGQSTGVTLVDTLDLGLAFDDLASASISADADLTTSIGTFNDVLTNAVISAQGTGDDNQGRVLTLDFGTITNSNRDNTTPETITLTYDVVVINGGSNDRGDTRNNDAVWTWNLDGVDETVSDSALDVTILEPELQVQKTAVPTSGDSGDTISYTIQIDHTANSNTDAYNVDFSDVIPADATYVASSLTCTESGGLAAADNCAESGGTISASWAGPFEVGHSATIEFDVTLDITVTPGEVITNTGEVEWTSLPGDVTTAQSAENSLTVERTGDETNPGGTENDYSASDDADVTVFSPTANKIITGTDQAFTTGTDAAIGEQISYQASFTVPEGTSTAAQLVDTLDAGLAFVSCDLVSVVGDISATGNLDCTSAAFSDTPNSDPENEGRVMTLDLGVVTNNDLNNSTDESITVEYTVVVLNSLDAARGDTLNNNAVWTWDGDSTSDSAPNVTVVEPELQISKSASPATGDSGDVITFTINVDPATAGDTNAYDVEVTDIIPAGMNYAGNLTCTPAGGLAAADSCTESSGTVTATWAGPFETGHSAVIEFDVTLDVSVSPEEVITNSADIEWTSLPGETATALSTHNPLSYERTGDSADAGGTENDYNDSGSDDVTIISPTADKTILSTNQTFTSGNDVVIGEQITYQARFVIPEGTSSSAQLVDTLDRGLAFVSCDSVVPDPIGSITAGNPLTCDSATITDFPDSTTVNQGRRLTLDLGEVVNSDTDNGTEESITVEYTVVVINGGSNDRGDLRNNSAYWYWNTSSINDSASNVSILEPELQVSKTASPTSGDAGDTITFTLDLSHTGSSDAPAYDVELEDVIPADMTYVAGSLSCTTSVSLGAADTCTESSGTISATWSGSGNPFPTDGSAQIQFQVTLDDTVTPGQTLANVSDLEWTSLPGDISTAQSTFNTLSVERTGDSNDTGGSVNDYDDSATDDVDVPDIDLVKSISPVLYTIGETLTYTLDVTLPEGATNGLIVVDEIPAGLEYVNHSVDGSGFNGTLDTTPSATAPGGSGGDLTLDFGDTTTTSDNDTGNNSFSVDVTVQVLNLDLNDRGDTLTNTGRVQYADGPDVTDTADITLTEPELQITKNVSSLPSEVDAGGDVTYQVTIEHTGTSDEDAYDLVFEDTLPSDMILDLSSISVTLNGSAAGAVNNSSGNIVNISISSLPDDGSSVEITYTAEIGTGVTPGQDITNTGTVTWTSLSGTVTEERDGSGSPTYNDYLTDDGSTITIDAPAISKLITGTDVSFTGDGQHRSGVEDLTIGEQVTFQITTTIPEGVSSSVQLVDDLIPSGTEGRLEFVDACVVSIGAQLSLTNTPALCPTSSGTSTATGVSYDFGEVTNSPDNVVDAGDQIVVQVETVVVNQLTNQDGDQLINSAEITIDTITETATVDLDLVEPDLTITKTVDDGSPVLGQTVSFSLDVEHSAASTADARDLILEDTLPSGFSYVTGSLAINNSGLSPISLDDSTDPILRVLWDSFPLAETSTITYQATVDTDVSPGVDLTNAAQLSWTSIGGTPAEERTGDDGPGGALDDYADQDAVTSTVTNPDLTITKDDGQTEYVPGTSLVYNIVVSNIGNQDVSGAEVQDSIPAQFSSWAWTCVEAGGASGCDGLADTNANFSDTVNIPQGGSITYTVTAQILSSASGSLLNVVTVDLPGGLIDPTPANNSASDTDTQNSQADLSVSKDDGLTVIAPGTTLTYTIVVSNAGPSDALNAEFTDTKPAQVTDWEWVCSGATGSADGCDGAPESSADFSDLLNLPSGSSITYTVTAQVSSSASGDLTNTAEITAPSGVTDTDLTNNSADDVDGIAEHSKLLSSTDQTFTSTPDAAIGEILTYQVTLIVPPGEMSGVTLTDTMDRGLVYDECVSITASSPDLTTSAAADFDAICSTPPTVNTYPGGSSNPADPGRQVIYNFGTLTNSGASDVNLVVTYQAVVLNNLENQSGVDLSNQAVWSWSDGTLENSADQVTVREPDLEFSKAVSPRTALPGQIVTFTLTVNHTAATETPAYDVVLTDVIPDGLTYVAGTLQHVSGQAPDSLAYSSSPPTLTVVWDELLNNGTNSVIEFDVTLDSTLRRGDSVRNSANLAWTSLPEDDFDPPLSDYNPLSVERDYDPASAVNIYGLEAAATIRLPALPDTGFAPGLITEIPAQRAEDEYQSLEQILLEIPALDLNMPVVSIPQNDQGWDLTWLWREAGWLEGTAYPTWQGNTVLTGHVYLANGEPGPLVNLGILAWGDELIILAHGQKYTYQVREKQLVDADDVSILEHKDRDWLTVFTCQGYDETRDEYPWRQVIQAVLIKVEDLN